VQISVKETSLKELISKTEKEMEIYLKWIKLAQSHVQFWALLLTSLVLKILLP